MSFRVLVAIPLIAAAVVPSLSAQDVTPQIVFRSSVDVVSVSAVVRDRKGRVVPSLGREDFDIVDSGERRPILELHSERTSPASVALLVDGSGSMRLGAAVEASRRISEAVLGSMDPARDAAALLSFDTRLITLQQFTHNLDMVRRSLDDVEAWGSTSLFDAIAGTAGIVAERARNRRAVVVLTDGADTTSAYSPENVSSIASSIDVPIYVFSLGPGDPPARGKDDAATGPALAHLARATGGEYFVANTPERVSAGIRQLIEELRHQYVIGFEPMHAGGLRRLEIRTRNSDLTVRYRKWYAAGKGE